MKEIIAKKTLHTKKIAAKFASLLQEGDIVGLKGGLAAGKTTFIKWIASEWGISPENITSTSFVIIKKHSTNHNIPFYHIDLYRLRTREFPDEIYDIIDRGKGVIFLEWAEKMKIPREHFVITMEMLSVNKRKITIKGTSPNLQKRLNQLKLNNI